MFGRGGAAAGSIEAASQLAARQILGNTPGNGLRDFIIEYLLLRTACARCERIRQDGTESSGRAKQPCHWVAEFYRVKE